MVMQNTVLVAEDNDFVRMQIVSFLREVGCDVLEASEGRSAGVLPLRHRDGTTAAGEAHSIPGVADCGLRPGGHLHSRSAGTSATGTTACISIHHHCLITEPMRSVSTR